MNYMFSISIDKNRYEIQCKNFERVGLPKPELFEGLKKEPDNELGCLYSHICLLMMCKHLNFPFYFCFEDDAYPRKDVSEKLTYYINNRPKDCGILVLGRNGQFGQVEWNGNDYYTIKERPFGAHSYIVFRECYNDLLNSFEIQRIADMALRGNNFKDKKPYWTKEYLFIQDNIDNKCMSTNFSKKGRYFYPDKDGNLSCSNDLPELFLIN